VVGPVAFTVKSPLHHIPLFVRDGGVILTIPQMQYTGQSAWSNVVVDAFVPGGNGAITRFLYEDDGTSPDYQQGAFRKTPVTLGREGDAVTLTIDAAQGDYDGAVETRSWALRLHCPAETTIGTVELDGTELSTSGVMSQGTSCARIISPSQTAEIIPFSGPGSPPPPQSGPVLEITIAPRSVKRNTIVRAQSYVKE